jgi:hypothetical protein
MVRAATGFTWAIFTNARPDASGYWGDLDQLGWQVLGSVSSWPSYDLF